ncbi:hypothetical protein ACFWPH_14050 [Nocardia sp. NPDC058499]|uniref:hypothetical protein n=1 Tax=Nocardia sp. NPDC058499 TaxID=3346530 RepID=UPI003652A015
MADADLLVGHRDHLVVLSAYIDAEDDRVAADRMKAAVEAAMRACGSQVDLSIERAQVVAGPAGNANKWAGKLGLPERGRLATGSRMWAGEVDGFRVEVFGQ